ncbi:hypothetical protein BW730_17675 [Tessaracoccus aquimaris]|uniref:Uncharacterized protein n=1 Tax=Tessaracoccus aquimaris TaxID=1332264 RepID=A0A1Q2CSG5_9ACTN|nr:DNA topoisomerase IB [Tessaracoccus aquimaris]AQP49052.1 hypothetical protein BW730_17675 [Tessaracoccus aquimaris]
MNETLHRVEPGTDPGISRITTKGGFEYRGPDGGKVSAAELARINALALPPAWTKVWICADPLGHIQAVGLDADGREQYRYHERWKEDRAEHKFDKMLHLAAALPAARGRATHDLSKPAEPSHRVLAVAFRFLDDASPRVGSIEYLERYGSRGLTTLQQRDVTVAGHHVTLHFPAKSHQHDVMHMVDVDLAEAVATLLDGDPEDRLLRYRASGDLHHLDPAEVNAYLHEITGGPYTAKDFRTLRGTIAAAESLARTGLVDGETAAHRAEVAAAKAASDALQNTPAVARSSYIDPRVFDAYRAGRLLDLGRSPDAALRDLIVAEEKH